MIRVLKYCSNTAFSSSLLKYNNPQIAKLKFTHQPLFAFSKIKKGKPEFVLPSIHISKYQQQHEGYLLYQNKQGGQYKYLSLAFIIYLVWAGYTYHSTDDQEIKTNFLVLGGFMVFSFILFQFRVRSTLKRLVLLKHGDQIVLTRFRMGGIRQQRTKARVQILKGIGKAFVIGGTVIKGGGVYDLEQRKYWFQSRYIVQPIIFEQVVQGRRIKVDRTKLY